MTNEPTQTTSEPALKDAPSPQFDQREEANKAIRFMALKVAIFILMPVIVAALAVFILL